MISLGFPRPLAQAFLVLAVVAVGGPAAGGDKAVASLETRREPFVPRTRTQDLAAVRGPAAGGDGAVNQFGMKLDSIFQRRKS